MNIPPFMATWRDPGTVTPFTTRTNASYLKILYDMREYMTGTLVSAIDAEFESQFTNITEQVDALIVQLNEHGVILDADIAEVNAKLAQAIAAANAASASAVGANNSAVAAAGSATAASNSATAASGSATAAAGSATAAAGSAATAATAGAAAGSTAGTAAGTAAASPYATAAAASATAAGTSATNAANSATAAATSATNAGANATAAIAVQKNAANGIAPLDATSRVPDANMPVRVASTNLNVRAVANAAALTTIADALVGDRILVTTPGNGVQSFFAECYATPSSTSSKWRPAETVIVDTRANLDLFIAAWISDADMTFRNGSRAYALDQDIEYRFTATNGTKIMHVGRLPRAESNYVDQSITTGVWNLLNGVWGAPTMRGGMAFAAGAFTVPEAGEYEIDISVVAGASAGIRNIQLIKNSTATDTAATIASLVGAGTTQAQLSTNKMLAAGDILRVYFYMDSATGNTSGVNGRTQIVIAMRSTV